MSRDNNRDLWIDFNKCFSSSERVENQCSRHNQVPILGGIQPIVQILFLSTFTSLGIPESVLASMFLLISLSYLVWEYVFLERDE